MAQAALPVVVSSHNRPAAQHTLQMWAAVRGERSSVLESSSAQLQDRNTTHFENAPCNPNVDNATHGTSWDFDVAGPPEVPVAAQVAAGASNANVNNCELRARTLNALFSLTAYARAEPMMALTRSRSAGVFTSGPGCASASPT